MMRLISVFISTIVFTFLFYKQSAGVNLLLMNIVVIGLLAVNSSVIYKNRTGVLLVIASLLSAMFSVLNHGVIAIIVNIISLVLLVGFTAIPQSRSILFHLTSSFVGAISSLDRFIKDIGQIGVMKWIGFRKWFKVIKIVIIPLVIILIFIRLYTVSNNYFAEFISKFSNWLTKVFQYIAEHVNINLIVVIIFGMIISVWYLYSYREKRFHAKEAALSDELIRRKKRRVFAPAFKFMGLKNEFRSALFLIAFLNVLLLVVNVLDVYWVWFKFSWDGQLLKQFVHEGTYILILSILLAVVLVLYFFRGNLNFYSKNLWLRRLSYLWMAQNIVLALSVAIRNIHYINYYALAYKRIAVFFFLLLTIFGIVTVIIKISKVKSRYYLMRWNSLALFVILLIAAAFNWDVLIAKYNFAHQKKAFVHLNYMSRMSYKALPYVDKPIEEIEAIHEFQQERFPNYRSDFAFGRGLFFTPKRYVKKIERKKLKFYNEYIDRHWLSWNYADHRSFQYVKNHLDEE